MQKRKSFREIARECNVSAATVSRIANGIGSFKEETRDQVMSRLLQEGYEIEQKSDAVSLKRIDTASERISDGKELSAVHICRKPESGLSDPGNPGFTSPGADLSKYPLRALRIRIPAAGRAHFVRAGKGQL